MLYRLVFFLIATWMAFNAFANVEEWYKVDELEEVEILVKNSSGEFSETPGKEKTIVMIFDTKIKKDNSSIFSKKYVTYEDCEKGYGELVTLRLNGSYSFTSQYVSKGTTLASSIGDHICGVYFEIKNGDIRKKLLAPKSEDSKL